MDPLATLVQIAADSFSIELDFHCILTGRSRRAFDLIPAQIPPRTGESDRRGGQEGKQVSH
jgi:hypothetical protein